MQLSGYADRLELDADGDVVVVDLKSGRNKPSAKAVGSHVQLRLYQFAVDHGAVDELAPGARAGGADPCSSPSPTAGDRGRAGQDPQPEDGAERDALQLRLEHASSLLRGESFPAVAGQHCRDCGFDPSARSRARAR